MVAVAAAAARMSVVSRSASGALRHRL